MKSLLPLSNKLMKSKKNKSLLRLFAGIFFQPDNIAALSDNLASILDKCSDEHCVLDV
jgi:hypothetical protein